MNIASFDMHVRLYFVFFRSTRVYMKICAQFSRLDGLTRVDKSARVLTTGLV